MPSGKIKTVSFSALDDAIQTQLDIWSATLGTPTCASGCGNCCRRPVMASSAEMIALIDHIESTDDVRLSDFIKNVDDNVSLIHRSIDALDCPPHNSNAAMIVIGGLGDCAFLRDENCSIYEARPYACRAIHVWHDSSLCTRNLEHGLPAELILERNRIFWDTMEKEALAMRFPFYGQLTVGLYYLLRFRDLYLAGSEFSSIIDPLWWQTGIINFPYPNRNSTPQDAVQTIRDMKRQDQLESVREKPYGLSRAQGIASGKP